MHTNQLRISWRHNNSGATLEIDVSAKDLGKFAELKNFLLANNAEVDSDGIFVVHNNDVFNQCCRIAGLPVY